MQQNIFFLNWFLNCCFLQVLNPIPDRSTFSHKVRPDKKPTCNGYGPMPPSGQTSQQANMSSNYQQQPDKDCNVLQSFEQQFMRVLNRVNQTIEKNEIRLAEQDERDNIKLEWQHVARILDRVLLTIFVAVTITTTCAVMLQNGSSLMS